MCQGTCGKLVKEWALANPYLCLLIFRDNVRWKHLKALQRHLNISEWHHTPKMVTWKQLVSMKSVSAFWSFQGYQATKKRLLPSCNNPITKMGIQMCDTCRWQYWESIGHIQKSLGFTKNFSAWGVGALEGSTTWESSKTKKSAIPLAPKWPPHRCVRNGKDV